MIRQLSVAHILAIVATTTLFALFGTTQQWINCLSGGLFVGLNVAVIAWVLHKIFIKKSIALAASVIVIKYAGLIGLFILLYRLGWQIDAGFVIGLATMFPTLGLLAYLHVKRSGANGSF